MLTKLEEKPLFNGFKVLDIPVGTPSFINSTFHDFSKEMYGLTLNLLDRFQDIHTLLQGLKRSILPRFPYRFLTDMVNQENYNMPLDLWSTEFTFDTNKLTCFILDKVN